MKQTTIHYELLIGETFAPHRHSTLQACIDEMNGDGYKGRNKNDGYDSYWQNRPFAFRKVTTTFEDIEIPVTV